MDRWEIQSGSLNADSFIVSGGVGQNITFEQDIVARFGAKIVLFDPSPTGVNTMANLQDRFNIDFYPLGIAGKTGDLQFGAPDSEEEGSFRKGTDGDGPLFKCKSLSEIMSDHHKDRIDLLKIDVEGFEYEIIQSIFDNNLNVRQICIEIHHNRFISIEQTIVDAAVLILQLFLHGYRIIYNNSMDFTFIKT